jgi:hypothetical protein
MYNPGTDWRLAELRHAEMVEEAAQARARRREHEVRPDRSPRRLVVAMALMAPLLLGLVVTLLVH